MLTTAVAIVVWLGWPFWALAEFLSFERSQARNPMVAKEIALPTRAPRTADRMCVICEISLTGG
jgi:hypothetical protein